MPKPCRTRIEIKGSEYKLDGFRALLRNLKDGLYIATIEKIKTKRTSQQNRYYWLYLNIIYDETGNDPDEMHEMFKRLFLPAVSKDMFGINYKVPNSTTKLSKQEFSDYIDRIEKITKVPAPDTELYLYN